MTTPSADEEHETQLKSYREEHLVYFTDGLYFPSCFRVTAVTSTTLGEDMAGE